MSTILDENFGDGDLKISSISTKYLQETAKWSKFISIIGFVGIGLMVLAALGMIIFGSTLGSGYRNAYQSQSPFAIGAIVYIILAVLYYFPISYLFKFSTSMKKALEKTDNITMDKAFENLKSHYKFLGIMMIVILSLYILIFLGGFLTAMLN